MSRRSRSPIEVLVILTILAALAVVLVPTVSGQVRRARVARVASDLDGVAAAVEAFLADVHRYPGDVEDLTGRPGVEGPADAGLEGTPYRAAESARWDGPYLRPAADDGVGLETGFGARIHDDFAAVGIEDRGARLLAIRVLGLDRGQLRLLDAEIDRGTGARDGRLRWWAGASAVDSIHFYVLPLN